MLFPLKWHICDNDIVFVLIWQNEQEKREEEEEEAEINTHQWMSHKGNKLVGRYDEDGGKKPKPTVTACSKSMW